MYQHDSTCIITSVWIYRYTILGIHFTSETKFAERSLFNNSCYPEEIHACRMSAHLFGGGRITLGPLARQSYVAGTQRFQKRQWLLSAGHFMSFPKIQLWWWDDSWLMRMNLFHESQEDILEAALHSETMVLVVEAHGQGFYPRHDWGIDVLPCLVPDCTYKHIHPCSACLIQHAAGLELYKSQLQSRW